MYTHGCIAHARVQLNTTRKSDMVALTKPPKPMLCELLRHISNTFCCTCSEKILRSTFRVVAFASACLGIT